MRRYTWMPTLVGGLLGGGLAVLLFSGHPNVDETWLIPNVLGLFVWYVPIAAWHECGYAAVARLVGLRVFAVMLSAERDCASARNVYERAILLATSGASAEDRILRNQVATEEWLGELGKSSCAANDGSAAR